ncbi:MULTISPECIES: LamG domain-containing protein [Planktothrix]|uniref:LamG-like jellyroll fold domain-containing protein n=1 Tax=Planktothrix rubescens CCAP 1459/22 TaxID=329571 RepID=A0A6J7ZF20_PLARU|nr:MULTISPECIES: LamG domain-containing protein [Planktothrix]CAC5342233.1 hypothetical protein PLAN_160107 [Planktothrix rubescens NIVA-CYA 18]CAD5924600.1 hypothetical protein PCC7821_00882 [Planktothrix rubescens NIVA-CYA 18]CAH2571435.1 hypothetical protein PRNO82_00833 [Planktothrix rubescens]
MAPIPVYNSEDKVYSFNGISDFEKVNNSDAINFSADQDFTIAVWVKAESQQKDTKNGDNDVLEKWISGSGGYPYVIRYINQKAGNSSGIIVAARYDGSNNPSVRSTSKVNDGQFHHVAFVRSKENNQGKLSLYINGKLEGSNTDTTTGNTKTNSPLYLGCRGYQNAGMNYFMGSIKGLSIYNVALSPEQIQAVVNPTPVKPIILDGQLEIPCKLETGVEFTNEQSQDVTFKFTPSGRFSVAEFLPECTSAGIKDFKYQDVMKYPNNTSFALLAVNKQTGAVVAEVGQETTLVVKAGETLIFILNDVPGCYCDNTSAITVNWSCSV